MLNALKGSSGHAPAPHRPLVIAHRGASGLAPENTLAAFQLAVALQADGLELDVQLSADGKPVVIHDSRVNRTTNGSGRVAGLTADELSGLDAGAWFERRLAVRPRTRALALSAAAALGKNGLSFKSEPVPDLESVLKLAARAGFRRVYVELKSAPARREALLETALSVIHRLRLEEVVTLLSFDHQAIALARTTAPGIRTAATFPVGRALATARSIARAAEAAAADEVALHYSLASRRAIDFLHERGLEVSVWTANSKLLMRRLSSRGVDAIMTNFPDRLVAALQFKPGKGRSLGRTRSR